MKYLGLILAVVVALMASQVLARRINEEHSELEHIRARRSLNSQFRDFLEKARIILQEGNATLGLPVMDPFRSEKMEVALEEDLVTGTAEATNFEITGLSGYTVDKAQVSMLSRKLSLGLTWPHIYSKGSYKLDAVLMKNFTAYGAGDYSATVTDLSFDTTVWLKVTGGVSIKKMQTSIALGGLELSATGLLDDEDTSKILSEVISDMAPQLLEDYQREITDLINAKVTEIVNEFLKGKSLSDIIAILG